MATTEHTTTAHTTKCNRCGRTLRTLKSIAAGYGPTCATKVRKATVVVATTVKATQVAKAVELITDGGIVPIRGRRVFRTVSSDGTRTYLTAPQACNCAAGLRSAHVCFHRVAAAILAAA